MRWLKKWESVGRLRLRISAELFVKMSCSHRTPETLWWFRGTGTILKDCRRFGRIQGETAGVNTWSRQMQRRRVHKTNAPHSGSSRVSVERLGRNVIRVYLRGLRVLAVCLMEWGTKQLRNQTSDRLQTVILDVTKTESVVAAASV